MVKYKLDSFNEYLFEWVDSFKLNPIPCQFSLIRSKKQPSLYGICDMIFNLTIPNQLDKYLEIHKEDIRNWIAPILSYQTPDGWFKDNYYNYKFRSPLTGQWEHCTAFAISALKILRAIPHYNLKVIKKLNTKKKVHGWLRRVPEWGLLFWPGSHKGGGIGAILAILGGEKYPHTNFFNWYFEWLDDKADPEVGFWRLGSEITK